MVTPDTSITYLSLLDDHPLLSPRAVVAPEEKLDSFAPSMYHLGTLAGEDDGRVDSSSLPHRARPVTKGCHGHDPGHR